MILQLTSAYFVKSILDKDQLTKQSNSRKQLEYFMNDEKRGCKPF
jgi:hypothetical protein